MPGITRPQTPEEKDLTPIGPDGNTLGFISIDKTIRKPETADVRFTKELQQQEALATKKGLPFARQVARDDFKDYFENQAKMSQRRHGYVKPEDIKPIKVDWEKYSDLKNFELISEREVNDEHLSKRHNKQVMINTKKYKFKGYSYTYTVQEEPMKAVARAK